MIVLISDINLVLKNIFEVEKYHFDLHYLDVNWHMNFESK